MAGEMIEQVTYAIMRAFFDREPDENGDRVFTVSPADNRDLGIAAMKAMRDVPDVCYDDYVAEKVWRELTSKEVWNLWLDAALGEKGMEG